MFNYVDVYVLYMYMYVTCICTRVCMYSVSHHAMCISIGLCLYHHATAMSRHALFWGMCIIILYRTFSSHVIPHHIHSFDARSMAPARQVLVEWRTAKLIEETDYAVVKNILRLSEFSRFARTAERVLRFFSDQLSTVKGFLCVHPRFGLRPECLFVRGTPP